MDKSIGSPSLTHMLFGERTEQMLPDYQPGVFQLFTELPDGWRRLRFIDVDLFRWPGDSKPEGYGELTLETVRWKRKRIGKPINCDDAVSIARHWLADWPGSVDFELKFRDSFLQETIDNLLNNI